MSTTSNLTDLQKILDLACVACRDLAILNCDNCKISRFRAEDADAKFAEWLGTWLAVSVINFECLDCMREQMEDLKTVLWTCERKDCQYYPFHALQIREVHAFRHPGFGVEIKTGPYFSSMISRIPLLEVAGGGRFV